VLHFSVEFTVLAGIEVYDSTEGQSVGGAHVSFGSNAPFRQTGRNGRSTPETGPAGWTRLLADELN